MSLVFKSSHVYPGTQVEFQVPLYKHFSKVDIPHIKAGNIKTTIPCGCVEYAITKDVMRFFVFTPPMHSDESLVPEDLPKDIVLKYEFQVYVVIEVPSTDSIYRINFIIPIRSHTHNRDKSIVMC